MIQATLTIGVILTVAVLIVNLIIVKVTPKKSNAVYILPAIFFAIGLICLLFATLLDRIWIMGAGLGGVGIASLFAAGTTFLVTAVADAYRQVDVN